tara:strand:- start:753 stop:2198 length:1446 start_codon:yes stop_codon:yes gene_type:complete
MVGAQLHIPIPTASQTPAFTNNITYFPHLRQNGNPNNQDYTCSIIQVVNSTTVKVDAPYTFEYGYTTEGRTMGNAIGTGQSYYVTNAPTSFTTNAYSLTYTGAPVVYTENAYNLISYANLILANLNPMGGDVYRIKTSMKSHGMQTWDLLADEVVEANEMLKNTDNIFRLERTGDFATQTIISTYWTGSYIDIDTGGTPPNVILKEDSEVLMNGMIISGSEHFTASADTPERSIKVTCKTPIPVFKDCEYILSFKGQAFGSEDSLNLPNNIGRPELRCYISGSGVDYDPVGNAVMGRRMDSGELKQPEPPPSTRWSTSPLIFMPNRFPSIPAQQNAAGLTNGSIIATATSTIVENFIPDFGQNASPQYSTEHISFNFKADSDGEITPVFQVMKGKWVLADVSIRSSVESGFTPNHTIIEARIPEYQNDDTLDFKFEFFDFNGVRADLIIVSESIDFNGGNFYINGEGYIGEGIIFDGFLGA